MIRLYLEKYSDGWAYAIETGHALRGLPSVATALDRAVRWLEAYDRIEQIIVDKIVTITRDGDLWSCSHAGTTIEDHRPGIVMVAAIGLEWLGRDDLYTVRMG